MTRAQIPPHGELPRTLLRESFATEQAVYGVLLVSGMIAVAGVRDATSWQVLVTVVVTVLVFWAAHVYAGTVSRHGIGESEVIGIRASLRLSVRESRGLLLSAFIPCAVLALGTARVVADLWAIWAAMWVGVAILAVLGYIAFARRGAPWPVRILGALITAMFGVVVIILKALIH